MSPSRPTCAMRTDMSNRVRWLGLLAIVAFLCGTGGVAAQGNPDPAGFKFNSGQSLQPVFEGWSRNADGTFLMWFGYLNRNYVETLIVPTGPDNKLEPGSADRGQPTYFDTRIHHKEFSVSVPKDWGKK